MKQTIKMIALLFTAAMLTISCSKDNGGGPGTETMLEDGFYLTGSATPFEAAELDGMFKNTPNEKGGVSRPSLYEIYAPMTVGAFQIQKVAGSTNVKLGGTLLFTYQGSGEYEQPKSPVKFYSPATDGTINITEAGMYHIVYDTELARILVTKADWGMRGDLNGWGFTKLNASADFKTFSINDLEINDGNFKFAYSGGWKIGIDDTTDVATVLVNTNFGGTLAFNGNTITPTLEPGGANYVFTKENKGKYTVTLTWAKGAFSAQLEKTGESTQPDYPENLYINGSFAGETWPWDSEKIITMIPVNGHPNAFWYITYFTTGTQFKFAPVKDWAGDFGVTGNATDGVYNKGGDNVAVTDAGIYMIYVDLEASKIYVGAPSVYLMGETSKDGSWDEDVPENLFTVSGTTLTHTTFGAGELRMYGTCSLAASVSWWQMEFIILQGKIEYRGKGGDQERVPVAAGAVVTLDYSNNTGTIL